MEKLKESKSGRKKLKFLSGESLMLRLGDNQVLQFHFPKDTTSRLHHNKAFSLRLTHTRCPRPPNRSTHSCLFPSFHTYRNPWGWGGGGEEGQSISVCVCAVYTCNLQQKLHNSTKVKNATRQHIRCILVWQQFRNTFMCEESN